LVCVDRLSLIFLHNIFLHNTCFTFSMRRFLSSERLAEKRVKAANAAAAIRDRSLHAWRYATGGAASIRA